MAKKRILNPDLVPYKQDKLKGGDVLGYVEGTAMTYGGNVNIPNKQDKLKSTDVLGYIGGKPLRFGGNVDIPTNQGGNGGGTEVVVATSPRSYNPVIDLSSKQNIKVLDIGNSFSLDPVALLSRFVYAAGISMDNICFCTALRSSGSFKTFYDSWHGNDSKYDTSGCSYNVNRTFGTLEQNITGETKLDKLHSAIKDCKWDVIMIHQVSSYSDNYDTWEGESEGGYLTEFLRILKVYQPQAMIGYLMPHAAYDQNSDTAELWQNIANATKRIQANYGIDFIIPVATAIENLRISSLRTASVEYAFSRDKHHLGYGLARYVAAATYFHSLFGIVFGKSVYGNSLVYAVSDTEKASTENKYPNESIDVTADNKELAQLCALLACCDAYKITAPDGIAESL